MWEPRAVSTTSTTGSDGSTVVGLSGIGAGDQAVVDGHHVVRAVLAHPAPPVRGRGVSHPGPPAQAVLVARHRIDLESGDDRMVGLEPAEPDQLLAHDLGLQCALRRQRDVLEVAAATQPRPGDRAGRLDPVRGRRLDRDRVAAPVPVRLGALGDLDDHAFSGQGVPDEHDPGRRS